MKNPFRKNKRDSTVALYLKSNEDEWYVPGYKSFRQCDEIKRCVNVIADHVSNMTIMLMGNTDKAGDERIRNSLARFVDIEPCQNMTRKALIQSIVVNMFYHGNAIVIPEYTKDHLLGNLEPLPMAECNIEQSEEWGYQIRYQGIIFAPDEVLHFIRRPDSRRPYKGLDCGDSLTTTIKNIAQENKTKTGFLRSEWKPSLIIGVNADAEELFDQGLRKNILESYGGKNGEPWLLPNGELDVKEVRPLTLKDLAIQESIELDIKSVAADLGVPACKVGIGEFKKEEHNNFVATTVMFVATAIQQELTKKLIYKPEWHFKFNNKSLMQFSPEEKVKMIQPMTALGAMTRNEARAEFDYSPSNAPGMDEFNVLENYIPVDKLGDQKKLKGGEKDDGE